MEFNHNWNKPRQDTARGLFNILVEGTGCSMQFRHTPCESCVKLWAIQHLKLEPELANALWLIVLSLREDTKKKEIVKMINEEVTYDYVRKYSLHLTK